MVAKVIHISKARQQVIDECHVQGHWWQATTVDEDHPRYLVQHYRCERDCGKTRRQKIGREGTSDAGESLGNSYNNPPDYSFRHGDTLTARKNIRKEVRLNLAENNRTHRRRRRTAK